VAAECIFEAVCGGRKLDAEQRIRAFTGCAVIASYLVQGMRGAINGGSDAG
jgi:hypothetical protein